MGQPRLAEQTQLAEKWPKILQKWTEQNINLTLSQKITLKLHYIVPFAEVNDNIIYIVKISPTTDIRDPIEKNFHYIFHGIFRAFSQKCKIYPSAVKIRYDSRHTVWVETYLIQSDIKLAENGRVDRNERARMEVHSAIFGQISFRPNGFRPDEFWPNEAGPMTVLRCILTDTTTLIFFSIQLNILPNDHK